MRMNDWKHFISTKGRRRTRCTRGACACCAQKVLHARVDTVASCPADATTRGDETFSIGHSHDPNAKR